MQQRVTISSGVHMQLYLPLNPQEYKARLCQAEAETRYSQKFEMGGNKRKQDLFFGIRSNI